MTYLRVRHTYGRTVDEDGGVLYHSWLQVQPVSRDGGWHWKHKLDINIYKETYLWHNQLRLHFAFLSMPMSFAGAVLLLLLFTSVED